MAGTLGPSSSSTIWLGHCESGREQGRGTRASRKYFHPCPRLLFQSHSFALDKLGNVVNEREDFAHTPIDNGESCQQVEDGRAGGLGCFQVGDGRGETNVWFEAKTHQQVIWTAMAE